MKIYKCDKCGTIIESEYDVFVCQFDNPEKKPDRNRKTYARAVSYDLCADCMREVAELLDDKVETDG